MFEFLNSSTNYEFLFCLVVFLSIVQSVFGVGLLLFGTPILLFFNHEFIFALSILLPSSFCISALQIYDGKKEQTTISKNLYYFCLPAIGIGFWMGNKGLYAHVTEGLVGLILISTTFLRYFPDVQKSLGKAFIEYNKMFHFLMGLVHGVTNLGGSILSIHASTIHNNKLAVRYCIAYYYIIFSSFQMIVVFFSLSQPSVLFNHLGFAAVSCVTYMFLGNFVFRFTNEKLYFHVFSLFMFFCGITIFSKWLTN